MCAAVLSFSCCQQLSDLETKVNQNTSDISELKTAVASLQSIVNQGLVIKECKEVTGGYELSFTNGKTIKITNGKDGDSFFSSVTSDPEKATVKFVLTNGNTYNVPLYVEKTIDQRILGISYLPEYEDGKLTWEYFDEKEYNSIKMKFMVNPLDVAMELAKDPGQIKYVGSASGIKTRATEAVELPCTVVFDESEGVFVASFNMENYARTYGFGKAFGVCFLLGDRNVLSTDLIPVQQVCTALEYAGEKYHTVTMKDGRTWMAENLRYVPEGMTPSLDPTNAAGLWYSAKLEWDGTKAVITPTDDKEVIAAQGLLYKPSIALKCSNLPTGEFVDVEDPQGICPDGWHIPSAREWISLVGACSNKDYKDTSAPYYDKNVEGAQVNKLNEDGLNAFPYPYVNQSKAYIGLVTNKDSSKPCSFMSSMIYYASSTSHSATQTYMAMITNNATKTSVNVAYGFNTSGVAVRCIKD